MRLPAPMNAALSIARHKMAPSASLEQAAATSSVLCAAENERVRPAAIIDGAIDRITGYRSEAFRADVWRSYRGEMVTHAPTVAYTFSNAQIYAGSAFAGAMRHRIRPVSECDKPFGAERIGKLALCTTFTGDLYFGHCLNEDLAQMLLADDFGGPARFPTKNWPHLFAYKELLDLQWREVSSAFIDELTIFSDFAQNSSRRARFDVYRERLRRKLTAKKPGGRFYLRRGDTGVARSPVNDDAICDALRLRGYDIIDIFTEAPRDFLADILDRDIVVSVEGSAMMHSIYTLPKGGGALALLPPDRPCMAVKDACDAIRAHFGVVVGYPAEGGYRIDLGELEATLDLIEQRVGRLETV